MPGLSGLLRNLNGAIASPRDWRLSRQSIVSRGAIQHVDELTRFSSMVRRLKPRRIVEIGTAQGGVFWLLCQLGTDDAILVSVDLPPSERFSGGLKLNVDLLGMKKPGQSVHAVAGNSHDPAVFNQVKALFDGAPLDVLFIDGDHSYLGVKQDYEMYRSLVRPRGIIAFHDIIHTAFENCQVEKFWTELTQKHPSNITEIVGRQPSHFGGIGVITAA